MIPSALRLTGPCCVRQNLPDLEFPAPVNTLRLTQIKPFFADAGNAKEPYKYVYKQQDEPFSFEIVRSGNQHRNEPIWNTTGTRLIYKEQYLEMTSWAPSGSTMYGLGERISTSGEGRLSTLLKCS